ncbi:hypothetical protein GAYE_SCF00G1675 [Galdieria yellowstonensis]|uniref:Chromosome segregation in meiosis protein 3 domain-containing protein n=1 Tax=Galdieria yellowstonensis TaxID=3028027 RepID=A0AAV9I8S8_9RHOD|nr:hypothetical protein GAYE_SCF00G1675 [Galdieria yellowstonensis]
MSGGRRKESRVPPWNEELVLNESSGIPQLIRNLETLQRDRRGNSLETVGKILKIWHVWSNRLSPEVDSGKFLSKIRTLQSQKRIRRYLAEERERRDMSRAERTDENVLNDSNVLSENFNTSCDWREQNNSTNENIVDSDFSDFLAECSGHLDSNMDIEPTQELDFHIDDSGREM